MRKLEGVDFHVAAENIAYTFREGVKRATSQGCNLVAEKEWLKAIDRYMKNPCIEEALLLLEVDPDIIRLFEFTKDPLQIWARNFKKAHE